MGEPECDMDVGDFEVVDECEGEDDDEVQEEEHENVEENENDETEQESQELDDKEDEEVTEIIVEKEPDDKDKSDSNKNTDDSNKNIDDSEDVIPIIDEKDDKKTEVEKDDSSEVINDKAVDSAVDVALDQMNDSDLLNNLDEIQNINLDPESFGLQREDSDKNLSNTLSTVSTEQTDPNESMSVSSDVIVLEDKGKDESNVEVPSWYEEKLNCKINTAKERLTKLSRVLKRSYQCYQECLDRVEEAVGSPVCKLFSPRRCPLNEPYINRWRFVCTKKPVEESAIAKMEEDNVETTVDKKIETVWRLEPSEGLTRNSNNDFQKIPSFVMSVVKTFEDYINSMDQELLDTLPNEQQKDDNKSTKDEMEDVIEITAKDTEIEKEENEKGGPEQWLWLLVRSNSKNELMLFATGKSISESTMDSLKLFFEKGRGSECNVKSLYCKSLTKVNNQTLANTTFLLGTEAVDETIGGLKIQLAPKTNFWLSTTGAEQLAKEVEMMVVPNKNTTVVDIGCGLGLIGLMMAEKCEKVIGLDSPSEVEEAEMTCELNKIENASFVMGEPLEVMTSLANTLASKKTTAIINANAEVGRNIDVITGLRKIPTLRRVVMITTLTKQSVHSILKLIQPTDNILGDPFVPIRAIVVDTLPIGPQFEVVIRMDRRPMHRIFNMHLSKPANKPKTVPNPPAKPAAPAPIKGKLAGKKFPFARKAAQNAKINKEAEKKTSPVKPNSPKGKVNTNVPNQKSRAEQFRAAAKKLVKNPFYDKPPKSWSKNKPRSGIKKKSPKPQSPIRSTDRRDKKFGPNQPQKDSPKRKRGWEGNSGGFGGSPDKRIRGYENEDDLRFRLANKMDSPDLIQQMERQQKLLEVAKEKLSGSRTSVDSSTAKQLQSMLKLAIENTNQVQTHLRRSVWDRIEPHGKDPLLAEFDNQPVFKGHYVQKLGQEDIIITAPNNEFVPPKESRSSYGGTAPAPVEPILLNPKEKWIPLPVTRIESYRASRAEKPKVQSEVAARWAPQSSSRRSGNSPARLHDELSPRRSLGSPHRRGASPSPSSNSRYQGSVNRSFNVDSQIGQRRFSPPRRASSPQRQRSPLRPRASSPPRRRLSPPRRPLSPPMRMGDDWDIPTRGAVEQQANWQRNLDRQQQISRPDPPPLMGIRSSIEVMGNTSSSNKDSWNISGVGAGADSWNSPRSLNNPPMLDSRYNQSNENWNIRGKESLPSRGDPWVEKQRWESGSRGVWNNDRDKEDWNDLPEDARDPWGDDGGTGGMGNDRWKFDGLLPLPMGNNWSRDDRPGSRDNWQNKSQSMSLNAMNSSKSSWMGGGAGGLGSGSSNMGSSQQSMSSNRWNMPSNNLPPASASSMSTWQSGSGGNNDSWRGSNPQNSSPFSRLRYFNCNFK